VTVATKVLDSDALLAFFQDEAGARADGLAKLRHAELITGDPDFKAVASGH
jgi:hypothetical protein